ncbi:hypothetical protein B5S32_g3127 [[Candida] boidinii]|nr:hypothetical protein B5S32_g3127 [[Candida] boidinii]
MPQLCLPVGVIAICGAQNRLTAPRNRSMRSTNKQNTQAQQRQSAITKAEDTASASSPQVQHPCICREMLKDNKLN